jgi:hypothetical protein
MNKLSLSEFASKVRAKNRICFGDVQRVQRTILGDGIGSREEAELLIDLDRQVSRADPAWQRWLVATLVDFVVWAERPTGIMDEEEANWLAAALTGNGGQPTKTGRLIAREVAREAQAFENEALTILAASLSKSKSRQAASEVEPAALAA